MSWQLLLAISIGTYVCSNVLQRVLLKEETTDPVAFAIVFQFLVGIMIGAYALLIKDASLPSNIIELMPNLLITTIFYGLGNIFLYKALKLTPISEFAILFSTSTLWTIVGAILILGERFSLQHIFGTILVLLSLFIVFRPEKSLQIFGKGQLMSLVAAALFGLAFINDAVVLKSFEVNLYVALAFLLPACGLLVLKPSAHKEMKIFLHPNKLKKLSIIVVFYAISAVTIFTAYTVGKNAGVISVINKSSSLLIVLAGILFLKEKEHMGRKLFGALIALCGVVLLII